MWLNLTQIKLPKQNLRFFLILIVLGFAFGWFETINKGPYSLHQWRQADCLSITQNYVNNNLNFFKPEIHWLGTKGNGKTVSEFPIVYFVVATVWHFLAPYHLFYRSLTLLFSFLGMFALFKISSRFIENKIFKFLPVLFLLGSPLYVYYANNYLMNVYALNLSVIGWYFFIEGVFRKKHSLFIWSSISFLIAALLKITSLFNPLLALFVFLFISKDNRKFINVFVWLISFFTPIVIWYLWSINYNQNNNHGIFLQGILPIWKLISNEIPIIFEKLWNNLRMQFLSLPNQAIFLLLFGVIVFYFKKLPLILKLIFPLLFIGFVFYIVLFYQVFDVHDYYLTNFLIIPVFVFILGIYLVEKHIGIEKVQVFIPILLVAGIAFSIVENRAKYYPPKSVKRSFYLLSQEQVDLWNWYHWHYGNNFYLIEKNKGKLQNLIPKEATIISIPDESINVTLYLINRKGNTDFGYTHFSNAEKIDFFKSQGAEYLLINDSTALNRPEIYSIEKQLVFKDGNLSLFKI